MLAPEIFTGARHSPKLANAHHKPGRGSPQKFQEQISKIGLKIHNVGAGGSNLTKL